MPQIVPLEANRALLVEQEQPELLIVLVGLVATKYYKWSRFFIANEAEVIINIFFNVKRELFRSDPIYGFGKHF
jgi:hypothetical protein